MLGLELAMAGWMELAYLDKPVQSGGVEIKCGRPAAPRVNVIPSKSRVSYDFSQPQSALDGMDIDTISPYGPGRETHVGGLMSGEIQVETAISFTHEQYPGIGKICFHYDTVDVRIHIDPTIYIASEYKPGTCKHSSILEHEKKHVKIDRIVVNKYAERIGKALSFAFNKYGVTYGPYAIENKEKIQGRLQDYIAGIVGKETEKMNQERQKRQQALDSLEEYQSVAALCEES